MPESFYFTGRLLPPLLVTEFKRMQNVPGRTFTICDLGCGDGAMITDLLAGSFLSNNVSLTGVDISAENVGYCCKHFPQFKFLTADVRNLPFTTKSFDFAYSWMVAEHLGNPQKMVSESFRVLKPGGKFFLATIFKKPYAFYFYRRKGEFVLDSTHKHEFKSVEQLTAMLKECGFEIESVFIKPRSYSLLELILQILRQFKFFEKRINRNFFLEHKFGQCLRRNLLIPAPGFFEIQALCAKIA